MNYLVNNVLIEAGLPLQRLPNIVSVFPFECYCRGSFVHFHEMHGELRRELYRDFGENDFNVSH